MKQTWFIEFETGGLLSEDKNRVTYFPEQSLKFSCPKAAEDFLGANSEKLNSIGLRPTVSPMLKRI